MSQNHVTGAHPVLGNPEAPNPFADSGLFQSTTDVWTPYKMSFEGFAGAGKTLTMLLISLALWEIEGKSKAVLLQDTERSAKFIVPFFRQYGLIEGKNFFVTPSKSLVDYRRILELANQHRSIFLIDTVTHLHEEMLRQFTEKEDRPVKYPGDAMILKPMWKEQFSTPFTEAENCHILFTGRAAWEYTMEVNPETQKKEFNATGVKMRGDNEMAYEPDVVVLMERMQDVTRKGGVKPYKRATILKDRSRLIDGKQFYFHPQDKKFWDYKPVWEVFEPVYRVLAAGNPVEQKKIPDPTPMGPLFKTGNAAAYWDRRRQVDVLLEEIEGVYQQWIPGSGGLEKQLKSMIFHLRFNTSSKSAMAERTPAELKQGLEAIEYLSRYVAKNYDYLEKLYDKGEYETTHEFLNNENNRFDKGETATAAQIDDDDKIPDFAVPSGKKPTPAGNLETALQKSIETVLQQKAAVALEKMKTDPLQAMADLFAAANSVEEIAQIEEGFAPVIEKLEPEIQEQIIGLAYDRRSEINVMLAETKNGKGKKTRASNNSRKFRGESVTVV